MKRREFLEKAGIGSAALVSLPAMGHAAKPAQADEHDHGHEDGPSGPLANATVSFGSWQSDPPHDRFPNISDRFRNHHALTPNEVTIKAGGTVNFIISGFHQVLVYGPGTEPAQISLANPLIRPMLPPLITDPVSRVYRGLDPAALSGVQDRIEVVQFPTDGRFLVICGVLPHFFDAATGEFIMFGFVRVLK